nr:MAG TPA: hypothetical protein [Caudoviricetes sp.]
MTWLSHCMLRPQEAKPRILEATRKPLHLEKNRESGNGSYRHQYQHAEGCI